jgi:undecaprenyl-diphosphatase
VGFTVNDYVESLFTANMKITGSFLIVSGLFLVMGHLVKKRDREISFGGAFVMGIAQALTVLPGLSRSGSTISTGLALGYKKDDLAKFSFLMVIIPVIGANMVELIKAENTDMNFVFLPLIIAFVSAFISGYLACTWMISIVRKSKLGWFAIYCFIVGLSLIFFT